MNGRSLVEITRADFRERTRRYGFLVTLVLTLYAGVLFLPARTAGYVTVDMDGWVGVYNAHWVGVTTAMLCALFLSFAGFYVVRGSIDRDRRTGVGSILAATPLSRAGYLASKALSHFLVLAAMTAVLLIAAFAMQMIRGEDTHVNLPVLLAPFLLIALPVLALTAAIAVLFETIPALSGSLGNVVWFFVWIFVIIDPIGLAGAAHGVRPPFWLDPSGVGIVSWEMITGAAEVIPGYNMRNFSIGASLHQDPARTFTWNGIDWTFRVIAERLSWFLVSAAVVLASVPFFDRFDTAVRGSRRGKRKKEANSDAGTPVAAPAPDVSALPVARADSRRLNLLPLAIAELRLMLKGMGRWWYFVAAGLVIGGFSAPAGEGGNIVRGLALIWSLPVLSSLGCREAIFGTGSLVFTSPRPRSRLLPAAWIAGVVAVLLTTAGQGLKHLAGGSPDGVAAWIAGACFVPALALASGIWTGNRRLFEALYLTIWYIGPMQKVTALDYAGLSAAAVDAGVWRVYGLFAAGLLVAAAAGLGRSSQNRA